MATTMLLLTLTLALVTLMGSVGGDRWCGLNSQHVCTGRGGYGNRCKLPWYVCDIKYVGGKVKCMCTRRDMYSRGSRARTVKPRPRGEPLNIENQFEWMIKMQRLMNRY